MNPEKLEVRIAMETEAGREAIAVWRRTIQSMSGPEKVAKAFELTETTRQIMREGIRHQFPNASEAEIQEVYVDRLLQSQGTSLCEVRRKQAAEKKSKGAGQSR